MPPHPRSRIPGTSLRLGRAPPVPVRAVTAENRLLKSHVMHGALAGSKLPDRGSRPWRSGHEALIAASHARFLLSPARGSFLNRGLGDGWSAPSSLEHKFAASAPVDLRLVYAAERSLRMRRVRRLPGLSPGSFPPEIPADIRVLSGGWTDVPGNGTDGDVSGHDSAIPPGSTLFIRGKP